MTGRSPASQGRACAPSGLSRDASQAEPLVPNAEEIDPVTPIGGRISYCAILSQQDNRYRLSTAQGNGDKAATFYWLSESLKAKFPDETIVLWNAVNVPLNPALRVWTRWDRIGDAITGFWLALMVFALVSLASAMSTGTAKTPKAVEGRSPASAVPEGQTPAQGIPIEDRKP